MGPLQSELVCSIFRCVLKNNNTFDSLEIERILVLRVDIVSMGDHNETLNTTFVEAERGHQKTKTTLIRRDKDIGKILSLLFASSTQF